MTHVALTCPRLGFTVGVQLTLRPGTIHDAGAAARLLEPHATTVQTHKSWIGAELVDSIDAVRAYQSLRRALPGDVTVQSVIASEAALALLADVPATWDAVRSELVTDDDRPPTLVRGVAAARHFRRLVSRKVPDAIADHQLPAAGLVLWSIVGNTIIAIDHEPFVLGDDWLDDVELPEREGGPRQLTFATVNGRWRITEADQYLINGRRDAGEDLAPGMVVQLQYPHAFVVLR